MKNVNTVRKDDETIDDLVARWKRVVKKSNILADYKRHDYFLKKSLKRKAKSEAAAQQK